MSHLPLNYSYTRIGIALVDPPLAELDTLTWSLVIPGQVLSHCQHRPDIICAGLLEDSSLLKRCHPYTCVRYKSNTLNLRLSRIALRPELVPLLLSHTFYPNEYTLHAIRQITAPILRTVHVNLNRCDCRAKNLREVTAVSGLDDSAALQTPKL